MRNLQVIGIVLSLIFAGLLVARYLRGHYRRRDILLGGVLVLGLFSVSVFPPIQNVFASLLSLENRLLATLVLSNLILFGLFFYGINESNKSRVELGRLVRALSRRDYAGRYQPEEQPAERRIVVVIPAYNEAGAISDVISRVPKEILGLPVKVLVIEDGSSDGTRLEVMRAGTPVASHPINRGQGDALRTGFEIALQEEGAEIVVTMDADGQHLPEEIENLVAPVVRDEADFVSGSRFLGEYERDSRARHLGIVLFTKLINLLGGVKITDCTNGFRAIRADVLRRIELKEQTCNAPELIMEAARKDFRILEIPITIKRRAVGESKKPPGLGYPYRFAKTIFKTWLR